MGITVRLKIVQKLIGLFIVGCFVLSAGNAAFASPPNAGRTTPYTRKQIIRLIEDRVPLAGRLKDSARAMQKGNVFWVVGFGEKRPGLEVSFNRKAGIITAISYNRNQSFKANPSWPVNYSRSQAKTIALSFLRDDFGISHLADVSLQPLQSDYSGRLLRSPYAYQFFFAPEVNGLPYGTGNTSVRVSATTGRVVSARESTVFLAQNLPSPVGALTPEQAAKALAGKLVLYRQYVAARSSYPGQPSSFNLVYAPPLPSGAGNLYVDARTGALIGPSGGVWRETLVPLGSGAGLGVPPASREARVLNRREAAVVAENVAARFGITGKPVNSFRTRKWYASGGSVDNFIWNAPKPAPQGSQLLTVVVAVYGGQVLQVNYNNNFGQFAPVKTGNPGLSWEKARQVAETFVKDKFPEVYNAMYFVDSGPPGPPPGHYYAKGKVKPPAIHNYNFVAKAGRAFFPGDNISVYVNRTTGQVQWSNFNWSEAALPGQSGLISSEQARASVARQLHPVLMYLVLSPAGFDSNTMNAGIYPLPAPAKPDRTKAVLVYGFKPQGTFTVAAVNGGLLRNGVSISNVERLKGEAGNDPHRKVLDFLINTGVLDTGKALTDDVTRGEMARMIAASLGGEPGYAGLPSTAAAPVGSESRYHYSVNKLVSYGIVKNGADFQPDRLLTREELARYLVGLAGLAPVARLQDVLRVPFSDALSFRDPALVNDAVLANGLGFVKMEGDAYQPTGPVTFAEAATGLYKALSLGR